MEIMGLKTCDTCRKARKALPEAGFRDVRDAPLDAQELNAALEVFGDKLVNRASTTWRGLSEAERARPALELLQTYPTLMKRPLVRDSAGALHLGWSAATRAALGVVD